MWLCLIEGERSVLMSLQAEEVFLKVASLWHCPRGAEFFSL